MKPPAIDPSGLADPAVLQSLDDGSSFDLLAGVHLDPPAPAPAPAPPIPPRAPVSTAGCPMHWTPAPLRASVLHFPKELAGRFMIPLYEAACACTRPGDRLTLIARIVPELGEITVTTTAGRNPETRAEPNVDTCMATARGGKTFEPFELGSDVVCPEPPPAKTKMGPPFFQRPRLVGCDDRPKTSLLTMSLLFDRSNEPHDS